MGGAKYQHAATRVPGVLQTTTINHVGVGLGLGRPGAFKSADERGLYSIKPSPFFFLKEKSSKIEER